MVEGFQVRTARNLIPMILKYTDQKTKQWMEKGEVEMVREGLHLFVDTMANIIFGTHFLGKMRKIPIEDNNGVTREMDFFEAYETVVEQSEKSFFSPINIMFPYSAVHYNIGSENRKIIRNH